jgi:hypothetical protein
MDWKTICATARISLGEGATSFFTEQNMRLVGANIQSELSKESKCMSSSGEMRIIPVAVVSQANIVLTGAGTPIIDGYDLAADELILANAQTLVSSNGIYKWAAGAWTRYTEFDTTADQNYDTYCLVRNGTVYADTKWKLTTKAATMGVNLLKFTQKVEPLWTYDLPSNFIEFSEVKNNGMPLDQLTLPPSVQNYPSGNVGEFFMDGFQIGLYPCPSQFTRLTYSYVRTTAICAFRFYFDLDLTGVTANACSISVSASNVVIKAIAATGTSNTVSIPFTTNTTVGAMVDYINTTTRGTTPYQGVTAILCDECPYDTLITLLDPIYVAEDCYGVEKEKYIFLKTEIPVEAHKVLQAGIIATMKMRDRENNSYILAQSRFDKLKADFVGKYQKRNISERLDGLNRRSRGNPMYNDGHLVIRIP